MSEQLLFENALFADADKEAQRQIRIRTRQREYQKRYYQEYRDSILTRTKAYAQAHPDEKREAVRRHRLANADKINARCREQRKNNPEKYRAYNEEYRERNRERLLLREREYYKTHVQEVRERHRKWYANNKDKARARHFRWASKNRDHLSRKHKEWYMKNRGAALVNSAKRRSIKAGIPFDLDGHIDEIQRRIDAGVCELTGIAFDMTKDDRIRVRPNAPSIDRIIPDLGYVINNVRVVAMAANTMLMNWGEEFAFKMAQSWVEKKKSSAKDQRSLS